MTADDEVKLPSVFYRAVTSGKLTFLLLPDGYRHQLHDVIKLVEVVDGEPAGPICFVRVLFIIADPALGLREGYAALAIKKEMESTRVNANKLLSEAKKIKE